MDIQKNFIDIHICPSRICTAHMHDYLELAYVLKGSAVHKINDLNAEIITEGDYFIIDYHTMHSYESVDGGEFKVINCLFLPQFVDKSLIYCKDFRTLLCHYMIQIADDNTWGNLANHIFHDDGKLLAILEKMLNEYAGQKLGMMEIMRANLIEILILTARKVASDKPNGILSDIITQINKRYNRGITLGQIADELNYSLPYVSKLFKKKTGMTFNVYLQKIRIDEACRLLINTNEKISEISQMVGYEDVDFFSKIFKKQTGMSPSRFRKVYLAKLYGCGNTVHDLSLNSI